MANCRDLIPKTCNPNRTPYVPVNIGDVGTILFSDGTLVINALAENLMELISVHGDVVKTYPSYSEDEPYEVIVAIGFDPTEQLIVIENITGRPWDNEAKSIEYVEFGSEIMPINMDGWFAETNVREVVFTGCDMTNLVSMAALFYNTPIEKVDMNIGFLIRDISHAFRGCSNLILVKFPTIDGLFDNLNSYSNAFMLANKLEAICSPDFNQDAAFKSKVFLGCTSLVGGNGTAYSSDHIGGDYAVIDRAGRAGYFTYCPDV